MARYPFGIRTEKANFLYVGRRIALECGGLIFRYGNVARNLTFIGDDVFLVEGRKDCQLRFPIEAGKAAALEVLWNGGSSDRFI